MKTTLVIAALAFILMLAVSRAADHEMQPGLWEIAVSMHMANLTMPTHILKKCITAADLQKLENSVMQPQSRPGAKEQCRVSDLTHNGNTVTWKGTCTGDSDMIFTGTMSFDGPDHYTGQVDIQGTFGGRPMQMSQSMEGHRLAASCSH